MATMKTPGVYIVEKSAFPNSVVEAPTAIPAFIGMTEKAVNGEDLLKNKPWRITSMTEFVKYFGGAPRPVFELSIGKATPTDAAGYFCSSVAGTGGMLLKAAKPAIPYTLYYNIIMFFANGGGTCYIVSTGTYDEKTPMDKNKATVALAALEKEQEVTMIVIPEAVNTPDCKDIQQLMLAHCGKMQNRFAILDVQPKAKNNETMGEQINTFRTNIGVNYMSYGAAYYPWLNTSVLSDNDMTEEMLLWPTTDKPYTFEAFFEPGSQMLAYANECMAIIQTGGNLPPAPAAKPDPKGEDDKQPDPKSNVKNEPKASTPAYTEEEIRQMRIEFHHSMLQNWPAYQLLVKKIKEALNLLPPSAAMAGIYTMVDNTRGVWKAPANLSVNYVNSLSETIDNAMQEELNVPMNGKAVNAIRTFMGEGIKVWGARTLDGNSLDWRYINVRRTMIFLEESVKNAARAYVFEPNDAGTWLNMRCMIDNFLRGIWKRGGLAGATPEDAYSVHVGLGESMTPEDILEGIMRITVLVAISHPAEFIEITFQQQMQKS